MILDATFPGQNYPPSTIVSFPTKKGKMIGEVQKLNKNYAQVTVGSNKTIWKVPYNIMAIKENKVKPEITLKEIYEFAREWLDDLHLKDWKFGFDLAQIRGGVCRHRKKEITLSVSYCCVATEEEVLDTVLHEIAHAIAGYSAKHGPQWVKVAKMLGCKAERYHSVIHGKDRWKGTCPCGQTWKRMKLNSRLKNHGICLDCEGDITWKRIT